MHHNRVQKTERVLPLDRRHNGTRDIDVAIPDDLRPKDGVHGAPEPTGEDCLTLAYVGVGPLRAIDADGQSVDLPQVDERRDASGTPLATTVSAIG